MPFASRCVRDASDASLLGKYLKELVANKGERNSFQPVSHNQEIGGGLAGVGLRTEKVLGVCGGSKDFLPLDCGWIMVLQFSCLHGWWVSFWLLLDPGLVRALAGVCSMICLCHIIILCVINFCFPAGCN